MPAFALIALSGIARSESEPPANGFLQDLKCLSLNLHFEAGNQSDEGMLAIGSVVANRASSNLFPAGICEVVSEHTPGRGCQFSWAAGILPWNEKAAWRLAVKAACRVLTGGAAPLVQLMSDVADYFFTANI